MMIAYHLRAVVAFAIILHAPLCVSPALAQATDAQRNAIRASCRSDFMSNCSGVQPGGTAAFQCLQQNMAKLSAACKSAVSAIVPQEVSKPVPAPKAEAPKPAPTQAETPKAEPSPAKTEAAPAKATPSAAPKAAASPPPKPATAKPKPAASAARPAVPSAAAPPTPPLVLRPLRAREEARVLRLSCGNDARVLCGAVQPGGGRIIQCLAIHSGALSTECREVLGQFAAQ